MMRHLPLCLQKMPENLPAAIRMKKEQAELLILSPVYFIIMIQ